MITKVEKILIERVVLELFAKKFKKNIYTAKFIAEEFLPWNEGDKYESFDNIFKEPESEKVLDIIGDILIDIEHYFTFGSFAYDNTINFDIFYDDCDSRDDDNVDPDKVLNNYKSFEDIFKTIFDQLDKFER